MKQFVKYLNILIFLILLALFFVLSPYKKLSTDLISLLPQNQETKLLKIYGDFQTSREVLVAIKGDNPKEITALEKRVLSHNFIALKKSFFASPEFRKYLKDYSFYLQDFDSKNISAVDKTLKGSYQNLISSLYYSSIDKDDPLQLFSQKKQRVAMSFKEGHLFLKNYGYMSVFSFKKGTDFKKVYDVFHKEMNTNTKIFSPVFYFVENSQAIKSQVNILVSIAIGILFLLYILILKDIGLLANTVVTLLSSFILSLLVVTELWGEVSIFVMVFGMSISTVAIDYMFHHYFLGYYEKDKGFNKSVFFGFLSTFLAFVLISFVQFPFIRQVSIYASASLLYSYIIFSFLFPKIGFRAREMNIYLPALSIVKNYKYLVLILLVIIGYILSHVKMDMDMKNLDYNNVKLKRVESFFKSHLGSSDKITFMIKAKSIDTLIQKNIDFKVQHKGAIVPLANLLSEREFLKRKKLLDAIDFAGIKDEIQKESEQIGFRKNFFKDAYSKRLLNPIAPEYSVDILNNYGFDILHKGAFYYSFGFVNQNEKTSGVYLVDSVKLFQTLLKKIDKQLLLSGTLILLCMLFIIYKATKENFFQALSYTLLPITFCLLVITHGSVNILQIFMLFIVVSFSIDYGIYISGHGLSKQSQQAILFSLMSTFAGFGILVFSSIGALFYIGEVATLGLLGILILILMGKR
ncbi:MAG: hypothetical protein R3331_03985 [Sulfurospirillaceae bacterium]|nr:hypothetical protein [Sulfurospirillaceae bacterium]